MAGSGDEVGHQPLAARIIRARNNHRFTDAGVSRDCRFDLPHLDPVSPDLDLIIDSAEEFDSPVRLVTAEVSRTIHASAGFA